ncbi:MAG: alpha/beta hydrolase fold domain-containing protein [Pseudorhodobacter sp.]|nr:alpha/beta hydrolase fold domain-containing protein [Frankiaceae bacterium]
MSLPLPVVRTVIRATLRPLLGPPVPLSVQRRVLLALSAPTPLKAGTTSTPVVLGGRPALRLTAGPTWDDAVLWAHGGAFITGSPVQDRAFASHLAAASGAAVYLPDYRLAPEHTAAEQVADLQAALSDLPEERVVIGGDSAGGCLALLVARAPARPLAGMALVSPVVDLTLRTSGTWTGSEIVVRRAWAEAGVAAAFGTDRPDLLTTDLDGLPPAVVHVSEHERLRPEGEALAQRLGAELVVLLGLWHVAHLHCGLLRESEDATARLGRSVRVLLAAGA